VGLSNLRNKMVIQFRHTARTSMFLPSIRLHSIHTEPPSSTLPTLPSHQYPPVGAQSVGTQPSPPHLLNQLSQSAARYVRSSSVPWNGRGTIDCDQLYSANAYHGSQLLMPLRNLCSLRTQIRQRHDLHHQARPAGEMLRPLSGTCFRVILLPCEARLQP
jgi:hypothetical protein